MVLSAVWIVFVLINIEKTKVVALSAVIDDDENGIGSELHFEESTTTGKQLEIELPEKHRNNNGNSAITPGDDNGVVDEITMATKPGDSRASPMKERGIVKPASSPKNNKKNQHRRKRRVSGMFVAVQCFSVAVLVLLTYLLLVVSSAPIALRILGSLCVFGIFLRYQIGDEIRRQRTDRLMLLLSLFLVIASMLSVLVYSMKSLKQGEIYEGPARIIGYDMEQYNNTQHDPTTRTDIAVSWGKTWGCPLSGGKVCQARVQGAMCQNHPDKEQTKHKPKYESTRSLKNGDSDDENDEKKKMEEEEEEVEDLEEDLEDEEKDNQDLESQNESLEEENEELKEEIEELKQENEVVEDEEDGLIDEENAELDEIVDEYDADLMIVEEEEYEDAQAYTDAEYELDEEEIEEEIESTDDDSAIEDLEEELAEDENDQNELDEEYEEDEEYFEEYEKEFDEASDEEADEFDEAVEEVEEKEEEKDELDEEIEETEAEINDTDNKIQHKNPPPKKEDDDVYEEMAEEIYEEEEEEIEEEYEEEEYEEWYWDEYPEYYDDDFYEDGYWDYDWDSVWGDYACEDLFSTDVGSRSYDINAPAGGDDEWPFVNIYGSCKTCEAYILDYFAEEAFEEVEEYKQQAIVYMAGALAGFIWALISYVKYRVMPTAENQIELLGSDGGVLA